VLRTFPKSVGRSVQNLVEIVGGDRVCKRDIGRYIGTSSLFYVYRYLNG